MPERRHRAKGAEHECGRRPSVDDRPEVAREVSRLPDRMLGERGVGAAVRSGNRGTVTEALVLGISLRGPVVPLALVIAFSLGNLPAALSSTAGMRTAGRSYAYIFLVWSAIAIGAAVAIAAGYVGFGLLSAAWPPRLQAFGAGALLAMAAETMIPEAFHDSPRFSGLLAAIGFGLLLLVDATTR